MKKLLLKCRFAPGDLVMMTAAVRDLHTCYPGRFLTDVRTCCPDLWLHNPHVTPLDEKDPKVETIDCTYPLINRANQLRIHCLHGFIDYLNWYLGLQIQLTQVKGDIHLSEEEARMPSRIQDLAGMRVPYWIVAAGGKFDLTLKWWPTERYQEVVDHFRGRVQFVQVGGGGHYHPRLEHAIDLRGRTDFRELIRLVHHAQGVLCPVTCLMHLAAGIQPPPGAAGRSCVVVAGGREPYHWEAYPGHDFLHTIGRLDCCRSGGCWRSRGLPLGDGDKSDLAPHRCVDLAGEWPRCMDMIRPQDVIGCVEKCLDEHGGRLTRRQAAAGKRVELRTVDNPVDRAPVDHCTARLEARKFLKRLSTYPGRFRGRGVVVCAGGARGFANAWVCLRMLRHCGSKLPVEVWHLGAEEMDGAMSSLLKRLGAQTVDALKVAERGSDPAINHATLKCDAVMHSRFREVLLLDADNVPVANPDVLFDTAAFQHHGAIFWPHWFRWKRRNPVWRLSGVDYRDEPGFDTGQVVLDKSRCWGPLQLARWYGRQNGFFDPFVHGHKGYCYLAWRRMHRAYAMPGHDCQLLGRAVCQHDFEGRRLFQHRFLAKWRLAGENPCVPGFWHEALCLEFLEELRALWSGQVGTGLRRVPAGRTRHRAPRRRERLPVPR